MARHIIYHINKMTRMSFNIVITYQLLGATENQAKGV